MILVLIVSLPNLINDLVTLTFQPFLYIKCRVLALLVIV